MVRNINGLGGPLNTPSNTERSAGSSQKTPASSPSGASQASSDEVKLSPQGKSMQALASRINDLPEVNIERAEKIKTALEKGQYKIDDLILADKILNAESLLGK